jgi:hypothetical protein
MPLNQRPSLDEIFNGVSKVSQNRPSLNEIFQGSSLSKERKTLTTPTQQKPDLIYAASGTTPEQLRQQGKHKTAALQEAGRDMITVPAHYFNQLLLNAPRSLTEKAGFTYPEKAENPIVQKVAQAAGIAGALKTGGKVVGQQTLGRKIIGAAAQGFAYSPTEDFTDRGKRTQQAAFSAAIPMAGAAAKGIMSKAPNRSDIAGRMINSLIKPKAKEFNYGRNPGLAVALEKLTGNSMDELAEKISQRKNEVGKKIEQTMSGASGMVNVRGILRPLDVALTRARKAPETNKGLIARLEGIRSDLQGIVGGKKMQLATPKIAWKIKKQIGDLTKWTGEASDDKSANKALRMVYGRLRQRIENIVPQAKGLNERYGNLMSAEIAAKNRDVLLNRQNMIGLLDTTTGLGAALLTSVVSGGSTLPSAAAGLTVVGARKILGSTAAKTKIASWLAKTEPSIINKSLNALPKNVKEAVVTGIKSGEYAAPSRIVDYFNR